MSCPKKVLVLGGNGFIGTNLCASLLNKGYEVYSFDRVAPQAVTTGIIYEDGDFFDDDTLKRIVSGMDVIVHAVSTINPGNSSTEYFRGYQKDFVQTVRLCELARDNNCKLVFLSSGGTVYGKQENQPIKENALPHPINHYGNVKLCIENTMLTFALQNELDVVVARIANPYGPGQDFHKGVGFIDAVIRNALSGNTIDVWGNGSVVRDYIYIDDVCELLIGLFDKPIEGFPVVNISTGVGASNNEILEIVRKIHGQISVNYLESRSVDLERVVLDNTKIKSLVNHDLLSLEEGVNRYYCLLRDNNWL